MSDRSVWQDIKMSRYPSLKANVECDVLVVGGGMTGLTAAYLLTKAGKSVCLIERDLLAGGDSCCTTAHLTSVTDLRLTDMAKRFGEAEARLVWQGGAAAINTIERIASAEMIDCEFQRVPAILHLAGYDTDTDTDKGIAALQSDRQLATQFGFEATFLSSVPGIGQPGVRFANQARFHPLLYLNAMAKIIQHEGGMIYEHTEATEFSDDPLSVTANGHQIQADYIIIATHVPLMGNSGLMSASFLQTKLAPHSSYVIGAKIPDNVFPEALFWDTSDPYFYLRIDQRASGDYAIFGGLDHKTGQADNPQSRFDELEQRLKKIIPEARTERRWSGQVIESNDGLPYIGETAPSQFAATGFCGNGMTFGTLAAMMACDAVEGRQNPWKELFAMERKTLSSGWNYLRENFDYPYYLLRDRLAGSESGQPEDLDRGCGKVLSINGQRVACSRDRSGRLNYVSAICSHMGCVVHWNNAAETWDCPCHGSRFEPTGKVIAGPAEQGLEKVTVDNAASLT